jgi:hypothetical protein
MPVGSRGILMIYYGDEIGITGETMLTIAEISGWLEGR